jgi:sugar phosphate isomerase/epimerase
MVDYSLSAGLFIFDGDSKPSGDPIEAVERTAAAGFAETELMAEGEHWQNATKGDLMRLKSALESTGLFPHTLHAPMIGIDLASGNEAIRRDGIEQMTTAMRILAELEGRTVIVHPTGRPGADEEDYAWENIGAAADRAHKSVSELVRVAEETGTRMALENLPSTGLLCRPLVSMQELRAFIADFPEDQVGLILDTGHACISNLDPATQARVAGERLIALHLQDVDGERDCHWVPGDGVIDWTEMGQALTDIAFDGAWTIEALSIHTESSADEVATACSQLRERWASNGMAQPPA